MPNELIMPRRISAVVKEGFNRLKKYRAMRAMFIKDYVGQYYKQQAGITGKEPINLIFAALRILVPNIAAKNPVNEVTTKLLAQKDYAELLSLSLDAYQEKTNRKKLLRGGLVDSAFGFGIFKTSIADSGEVYDFENIQLDNGQLYTALIDLDDFVCDPLCTSFDSPAFLGHKILIPRQELLDADGWNHDLIIELPLVSSQGEQEEEIKNLTQKGTSNLEMRTLQDLVCVVELWVPKANAIIHIPDPRQKVVDEYLKIDDYYGPKEGPYTFMSLTPPIPNNPFPVAPVGLWRDLHGMANRVFHKLMAQADRQKDFVVYKPEYADIIQAMIDAPGDTIEAIACNDPSGIAKVSFGGQNPDNERMLVQLQTWFNYIAGNPDQLGGVRTGAETATGQEILQANATVSIQDMRDIVYDVAGEISMKEAWFLHHDPMIQQPLTKRETGNKEIQLWLTPEQRRGDFLRLGFRIKRRSMSVLDPTIRAKRIMEFMTNVLPAGVNAAYQCMQIGMPFNLQRYLTKGAEELGIGDWMAEIFVDPEFQQKLATMLQVGMKDAGKASPQGFIQNQGFPMKRNVLGPTQEINQARQEPAAVSQSARRIF